MSAFVVIVSTSRMMSGLQNGNWLCSTVTFGSQTALGCLCHMSVTGTWEEWKWWSLMCGCGISGLFDVPLTYLSSVPPYHITPCVTAWPWTKGETEGERSVLFSFPYWNALPVHINTSVTRTHVTASREVCPLQHRYTTGRGSPTCDMNIKRKGNSRLCAEVSRHRSAHRLSSVHHRCERPIWAWIEA